MLDDSGSMSGKPWNSLIDAFKNFMRIISTNQDISKSSKVSAVKYNDSS
jgi:hypothetical protein